MASVLGPVVVSLARLAPWESASAADFAPADAEDVVQVWKARLLEHTLYLVRFWNDDLYFVVRPDRGRPFRLTLDRGDLVGLLRHVEDCHATFLDIYTLVEPVDGA